MYLRISKRAKRVFAYLPPISQKYVLDYITHLIHRQLSPSHITGSITAINQFFRQLPKEKMAKLSEVQKEDIRNFVEKKSNHGLKAGSMNWYLKILRGFFAYLVDEDHLLKNPVLYRYHVEEERRLPRPMKEVDLKEFLNLLKEPFDRAVFLLMLRCGLRNGEVCRLKVSHISFERKNLIVRNGKGKVDRIVYFSRDAQEALINWMKERDNSSEYCFPSPTRQAEDKSIKDGDIRKRMKELLHQCGLENKGYTPHTLRHTFATTLLNAGVSLYVVRDLMGHKDVNQTLMYAQLYDQTVKDSYFQAMQKLEQESPIFKKEVASGSR